MRSREGVARQISASSNGDWTSRHSAAFSLNRVHRADCIRPSAPAGRATAPPCAEQCVRSALRSRPAKCHRFRRFGPRAAIRTLRSRCLTPDHRFAITTYTTPRMRSTVRTLAAQTIDHSEERTRVRSIFQFVRFTEFAMASDNQGAQERCVLLDGAFHAPDDPAGPAVSAGWPPSAVS